MPNEESADQTLSGQDNDPLEKLLQIQKERWQNGDRASVEDLIREHATHFTIQSPNDLLYLICQEVSLRESFGEEAALSEYQHRFPELTKELAIQWEINRMMRLDSVGSHLPIESTMSGDPGPSAKHYSIPKRFLPHKMDRYEILSELGRGAVGVVYKAWDPKLKRFVAIKRLRFGSDASDEELQRIRSEAEAIAHVRHENVVQIFDVGEIDGQPYLAMELCLGGCLSSRLSGKPIPAKQAALLLQKIAAGISAAHENKVIHRDLKPSNVLLNHPDEWDPKVTDFGLAKLLDGEGLNTETGFVLGTPTYMPPEQASGGAKNASVLMDVYALGAILYECLTGRPPFRGLTVTETLDLVRNVEPISIRRLEPRVPIELETIASKCLRKVPEQRYASARELIDDLQRFLEHRPIIARRKNLIDHGVAWCRRNPALTGALTSIVIITVLSLATLGWLNIKLRSESLEKSLALREKTEALREKTEALGENSKNMSLLEQSIAESKQNERMANQHFYNARISLAQQAIARKEMARAEDLFVQLNETQLDQAAKPFIGFEWNLLRRALQRDLVWSSDDQPGEATEVGFSMDDKLIVAVGGGMRNGYVRILDVSSGKSLVNKPLQAIANACAFDPTGKFFAIASANGLTVRDTQTAEIVKYIATMLHAKSLRWSADGTRLLVGDESGKLGIWNAKDYTHIATLNAEQGPILRMFFSADQKRLYSSTDWGAEGRHSTQWSFQDGQLTRVRDYKNLSLSDESQDGQLVAGMNWGKLIIADVNSGAIVDSESVSSGPLHSVRFQENNQSLLIASRHDRELRSFSRETRQVHRAFQVKKSLAAVAISHDKKRWATADATGEIRVWGVSSDPEPLMRIDNDATYDFAQFLPGGTDVLLANSSEVRIWNPQSNSVQTTSHAKSVQRASRNATVLVGIDSQTDTSKTFAIWNQSEDRTSKLTVPYAIYQECLELSPSGRWLASRGDGTLLDLFDLRSSNLEKPVHRLDAHCFSFAFSEDEKWLVGGVQYGEVRSFEVESGIPLKNYAPWQSFWAWGMGCAFSPGGMFVACGNESGAVHVWNRQTYEMVSRLTGNQGEVRCIAFFPDNKRLVSGGTGDIRLWDFRAGQELLSLPVPGKQIKSVQVNESGDAILALTIEGRVSVWLAKP